ncbi:hypothetical protein BJX62DRAFT_241485 [Aspergillus germanicus]
MVVRVKLEGAEDPVPVIDTTQFPWMADVDLIRDRAIVHGQTCLPRGYAFAYVPIDAPLSSSSPPGRDGRETNEIASSYNFPKAVISLVLATTCIAPEYPNLYMVRTSIMIEAERNGGLFTGEIATLDLDCVTNPKTTSDSATGTWLGLLLGFVPLIIVGALTGFIMAWFVVGIAAGPGAGRLWGRF